MLARSRDTRAQSDSVEAGIEAEHRLLSSFSHLPRGWREGSHAVLREHAKQGLIPGCTQQRREYDTNAQACLDLSLRSMCANKVTYAYLRHDMSLCAQPEWMDLTSSPSHPPILTKAHLSVAFPKERTADAVPAARAMRSDVGNVPPQGVLTHTLAYDA